MSKSKPASKLTHDELARRVFPSKVVREAKKVAHRPGSQSQRKSSGSRG